MRFKTIQQAEKVAHCANEVGESVLTGICKDAYILYVIPEISKEQMMMKQAAENNEIYDPLSDNDLTLEQVTKYIND